MTPITQLLEAANRGDRQAAAELLPLVYDELRKLAAAKMQHEKPGQTLNATALVHEAYLRLVASPGRESGEISFQGRGHFFAAAAEAMRRILVEKARRKARSKHGGDSLRQPMEDELAFGIEHDPLEILAVHELIDRLSEKSPRKGQLVHLRFFLGCTIPEAAAILGIAPATAEDDWTYAKTWLRREWLAENPKKTE